MIDKNDVKMPVQKRDADLANNKEQVAKIEELLRLVNDADNKQELRLKGDYYSRFHWFGSNIGQDISKSYFSYQEEAVYDFVFNLNKSGILSDQVGMGKTIEAGMIISELASRNELRSLLIIVPNEILAQKWEYELESKFGIKEYNRINANGVEEVYPTVKALKNIDDFSRCIFDCVCNEKFVEYHDYDFSHRYKFEPGNTDTLAGVIESFVKDDIREAVDMINRGFEIWEMEGNPQVVFDGESFAISGTDFKREYKYDASGLIAGFLNGKQRIKQFDGLINNPHFAREYRKILKKELDSMFVVIGRYFATLPDEISAVSESMVNNNPILVIPIAYSQYNGDEVMLKEFLNHILFKEMRNYKHKYNVQNEDGIIEPVFEDYRIVDFFIDVGYQTLIVDEVHDYIDVASKMERSAFHKADGYRQFPSSEYNRYELFDDYYFIKKSSLYKKLKSLADKANRKIFLTATPIKSDMVDFYLLTLLASNKDAEAYKNISDSLRVGAGMFATLDEIEQRIEDIYQLFNACIAGVARNFCDRPRTFLKEEERDHSADSQEQNRVIRCVYPYFNNTYLRANVSNQSAVEKYLNSHISYMSVEEIIMELIIAYNAETKENSSTAVVFNKLLNLLALPESELQTRVVFRAILNNTIKLRFEEDFTDEDGNAIKMIRELLKNDDGARKWHKTYRKYGIRHTRHQTYNLSNCEDLDKLNKVKVERYQNLPIWPKRDGKVIYLLRDDVFFDSFLNVRRDLSEKEPVVVKMEDLPNIDKMTGDDEVKAERFENAVKIFDYINNSMSGGSADKHEPQFSKYESVDLDDAGMVDYKLALVNKLMLGSDPGLGSIKKKVLLFAENDREEILEWFRYQQCQPLYTGTELDPKKLAEYESKWASYEVQKLGSEWRVSENTEDLNRYDGNLLIIIDPKRYEKGVDLQKADTMINFDINYDPLKMEQRIGRIDRIRPKGQSQQINIISFVPLNNMSGFVINFFAYELKMFTQWMGETTGIVSVPDEDNKSGEGQQVSFEGKVYNLEKYYKYIYDLCRGNVESGKVEDMAEDFRRFFELDDYRTKSDFAFLQALRPSFDRAFSNSISPQCQGYAVDGSDKRVMRFNSANGVFVNCGSESCDKCPNKQFCRDKSKDIRNNARDFASAVKEFFEKGEKFYAGEIKKYQELKQQVKVKGASGQGGVDDTKVWLEKREASFKKVKSEVHKALSSFNSSDSSFTVPFDQYKEIFSPLKELYWDEVVGNYMGRILGQFYKQCDSVLDSAGLFEKFIKTLSIADFMNNMEGNA